jgi:nucleoside-diphosphate-sugar epimerase
MADSPTVLVTGSAGRIGQAVVRELQARGLPVRGFDRVPTPGVADSIVGSITDAAALRRAAAGADALIHLAATPDDDDFHTQILPNNIVGVYEVLEAARLGGVRRLVLASSGQVVWYQRLRGPWPIGPDVPPSPRYWYAAAKLFLEAAGRAYAEAHDMTVLAVRIGWVPRSPEQVREIAANEHAQDVYLSPGDAGRFFACAVEAPLRVRFAVVYATSLPVRRIQYDLTFAREQLGYEPRDRYPEGLDVSPTR